MQAPEVAMVSTGTGSVDATFPGVEFIIGVREPGPHWFQELPVIHHRYGVSPLHDSYGAGHQDRLDL